MPLTPVTQKEIYLAKASGDYSGDLPEAITREEKYLKKIAENGSGGGGDSGTTNYNELENKPKINNIPLVGNKSTADLGIIIPDVSDFITDTEVEELLADYVTETVFDSTIAGFYTKSETDALLTTKADKATTYTKTETDTKLSGKADLINGTVPLSQIPPAAIERLVTVVNDSARFALTTAEVQLGDTVRVTATNKMYIVIDTDHLDGELGYQVYVAGKAAEAVADQNGDTIDTTYVKIVSGKQLSTEDYTTAEKTKLADLENYDDSDVKSEIGKLVDTGAKNHAIINNGSYTATGGSRSYKIPVSPISGTIVFYCKKLISSDTDSTQCAVELKTSNNTVAMNLLLERNTPCIEMFTVESSITSVEIYPATSWQLSVDDTITVEEFMLCTAEDYEASPEFVPYVPTNRELYEMILALQNGG